MNLPPVIWREEEKKIPMNVGIFFFINLFDQNKIL